MIKINRNKVNAFTLIELLVVIFIIGIVSASILLKSNKNQSFKETQVFAEQLKSQLERIQEQASTQLVTLSLAINAQHYAFYQYKASSKQWTPLQNQDAFWKTFAIPSYIKISVTLVKSTQQNSSQIIFSPSGEITPFTLTIHHENSSRDIEIKGDENGHITLLSS